MSKPISTETAERYTWGDNCDGWYLLRTPELSVIEERMPTGTSEVRHFHRHSRQFFYVLTGNASIEVDGQQYTLGSGQGLEVAPGMLHQIFNPAVEELRFLVVSQPPSHGDRVRSMGM